MSLNKKTIINAINQSKKASKKRNFKQSIDLILVLQDINLKKPENRINELIELTHPLDKHVEIGVFASGDIAMRAKAVGIQKVFKKEDLEQFSNDKKAKKKIVKEIDFFLAEAPMMPQLAKTLGSVLGPRGKMPTPIPPTAHIETIIEKYKRMVQIRIRDQLNVQCRVGTEDMSEEDIAENIQTIVSRLEGKFEKGRRNIRRAYVKTTLGSPVKIEF